MDIDSWLNIENVIFLQNQLKFMTSLKMELISGLKSTSDYYSVSKRFKKFKEYRGLIKNFSD